ncbi:hypothetical protein ACLMJK_000422 [Lecanora helva]
MADNACQSLPLNTSQSAVNQERTSPSAPSSASDEKSTSSTSTRRRKQSSMSTNNATSSRQPRESTRQRQKAQALPTRSRGESSRGATATMPGLLDQEITYTPTTHRISKAKKGKKVHACEFPGCTKVDSQQNIWVVRDKANGGLDLYPSRAPKTARGQS